MIPIQFRVTEHGRSLRGAGQRFDRAVNAALDLAGRVALERAKLKAPGKLKESMKLEREPDAFAISNESPIATFVENGTVAHIIEARGGLLRFQSGGSTIFARRVHHPGTKPNPVMHDAVQEGATAFVRLMQAALNDIL